MRIISKLSLATGLLVTAYLGAPLERGSAAYGTSDTMDVAERRSVPPSGAVATPPAGPKSHYRTLLRQLEVPDDRAKFGDFYDFGYWAGANYAGNSNLPPGYWVYLAPHWYIFKDADPAVAAAPAAPRPWGPEQATGAPDTWPNAGDLRSAWASQTPDGQPEWLELTYEGPVRPTAILIYETFNPGAVHRVTTFNAAGAEVELWSGADPTPVGSEKGISLIPVKPALDVTRIRIYIDSPEVKGWNEIDAVGLLDEGGTTHWAKSATASSTYADVMGGAATEDRFLGSEAVPTKSGVTTFESSR